MPAKLNYSQMPKIAELNLKEQIQPHLESTTTLWSNLSEIREGAIQFLLGKDAATSTSPTGVPIMLTNSYCATFTYRYKKVRGKNILSRELLKISLIQEEDAGRYMGMPKKITRLTTQLFDEQGNVSRCFDITPQSASVFEPYIDGPTTKTRKIQYETLSPTTSKLLIGDVESLESNVWTPNVDAFIISSSDTCINYIIQSINPAIRLCSTTQGSSLIFFDKPIANTPLFMIRKGQFTVQLGDDGISLNQFFSGGLQIEYDLVDVKDTDTPAIETSSNYLETCTVQQTPTQPQVSAILRKTFFTREAISAQAQYNGLYQLDSFEKKITATYVQGIRVGVTHTYDKIKQTNCYSMELNDKLYGFEFSATGLNLYVDDSTIELNEFLQIILRTSLFTMLTQQLPYDLLSGITILSSIGPQAIFGENIGPIQEDRPDERVVFSVIPGVQHWHHYLTLFQLVSCNFRENNYYTVPNKMCHALDYLQILLPLLLEKKPIPASIFHEKAFTLTFGTSLSITQALVDKKIPLSQNISAELRVQLVKELKPCLAWIMRRLNIIFIEHPLPSSSHIEIAQLISHIPSQMLKIAHDERQMIEQQTLQKQTELLTSEMAERTIIELTMHDIPIRNALKQMEKQMYESLLRHHQYLQSICSQLKKLEHVKSSAFSFIIKLLQDLQNSLMKEDTQRHALVAHEQGALRILHSQETEERCSQLDKEQSLRLAEAAKRNKILQNKIQKIEQSSIETRCGVSKDEKDERKTIVCLLIDSKRTASIAYAKTRDILTLQEEYEHTLLYQQHRNIKQLEQVKIDEHTHRESIASHYSQPFSLFSQLKAEHQAQQILKHHMSIQRQQIADTFVTSLQPYRPYRDQLLRVATSQKQRASIFDMVAKLPLILRSILQEAPWFRPMQPSQSTMDLYRIEIALYLKRRGVIFDDTTRRLIEGKANIRRALSPEWLAYLDDKLHPIIRIVSASWLFLLHGYAFTPEKIQAEMEDCQTILHHIKNRVVLKEYFCYTVFALCHSHDIPILLKNINEENAVYLSPEAIVTRQNNCRQILSSELAASPIRRSRFFKPWTACETIVQEGASVYLETVDRFEPSTLSSAQVS